MQKKTENKQGNLDIITSQFLMSYSFIKLLNVQNVGNNKQI